jgi:hypothetical protein
LRTFSRYLAATRNKKQPAMKKLDVAGFDIGVFDIGERF